MKTLSLVGSFGPKNPAHEEGGNKVDQRETMLNNLKTEIKEDEYSMGVLKKILSLKIDVKDENPTLRGNPRFNITEDRIVAEFANHVLRDNKYTINQSNRDILIKSFCKSKNVAIEEDLQKINSSFTLPIPRFRDVAVAFLTLNQILPAGAPVAPPPPDCGGQQSAGNANCHKPQPSPFQSQLALQTSFQDIGTTTALANLTLGSSVVVSNSTSYRETSAEFLARANNASAILNYSATPIIANSYSPTIVDQATASATSSASAPAAPASSYTASASALDPASASASASAPAPASSASAPASSASASALDPAPVASASASAPASSASASPQAPASVSASDLTQSAPATSASVSASAPAASTPAPAPAPAASTPAPVASTPAQAPAPAATASPQASAPAYTAPAPAYTAPAASAPAATASEIPPSDEVSPQQGTNGLSGPIIGVIAAAGVVGVAAAAVGVVWVCKRAGRNLNAPQPTAEVQSASTAQIAFDRSV